jgi:hypothetical protein
VAFQNPDEFVLIIADVVPGEFRLFIDVFFKAADKVIKNEHFAIPVLDQMVHEMAAQKTGAADHTYPFSPDFFRIHFIVLL